MQVGASDWPIEWETTRPVAVVDPTSAHYRRLVVAVAREVGGPLVVAAQLGVDHARAATSIQVAVLGLGPPIVIAELGAPLPNPGLEVRTSGLWADHVCEHPYEHWSYGLEAFALAVDDPAELLGRGFGDRVPLGWELEFETSEAPEWLGPHKPQAHAHALDGAYRQLGSVHGVLLGAHGELAIEGRALRSHRWGDVRPGVETILADGGSPGEYGLEPSSEPESVALPGPDGIWWVGRTLAGASTHTTTTDAVG